jgi:formate hydrogenlyase subunit 3/multisubunit Na+/H+ antiporter MnhD subunit
LVISGILTALIGHFVARVQSSVKSQIAYSSIAQIGLIFIEIALGLHSLALIHIAGNAFLRTYQLLVSPSVVAYKIKEQFYSFKPKVSTIEDSFPKRLEYAMYMLSLKEFNLDFIHFQYLWRPLKRIGSLKMLSFRYIFYFIGGFISLGVVMLIFSSSISEKFFHPVSLVFGIIGLLAVIKAFTERESVRKSWTLIMLNHVLISVSVSFNEHFDWQHNVWYLSGILLSWSVGLILINRMRAHEQWISLDRFYGHAYEHPKQAFVFLLCCLGISGFPITPSFVGEDLIFSHIHSDQVFLAFFIALSLIVNGLASMRIYSRVFLGPHIKTYHEVAKRSS